MRSISSLLRLVTQGALALLPHAPSSTPAAASQPQHLRGVGPAAAAKGLGMSLDTHAHYHHRDAAADGAIALGAGDLAWTADGKKIKVNGRPFHLKGLSWFGFELEQGVLLGLEQRPLDEILQFLKDNAFNALRLPYSTKWALDYDKRVWGNFKDGDINGMTRRQILNKVRLVWVWVWFGWFGGCRCVVYLYAWCNVRLVHTSNLCFFPNQPLR